MTGQPWCDLQQAFARFLHLREDCQSFNDIVSVVQFDHSAHIVHEGIKLSTNIQLATQHAGETQFCPPLDYASSIMYNGAWSQSPVLVFMSDGQAHDDPEDILRRIMDMRDIHQMQLHTVSFGSDDGHDLLRVRIACIINSFRSLF